MVIIMFLCINYYRFEVFIPFKQSLFFFDNVYVKLHLSSGDNSSFEIGWQKGLPKENALYC